MIFRCSALVLLFSLASCTLVGDDFEPQRVDDQASPEGETDVVGLMPATSDPGAEAEAPGEAEGAADVPPSTEAPEMADLPLAPGMPSSSNGASTEPSGSGNEPSGSGGTGNEPSGSGGMPGGDDPPVDDPPGNDDDDVCSVASPPGGACPVPTCFDGVRNQDERASDCGGSACLPCPCAYGTPEVLGDPNYPGNLLYSPMLSPNGLTLYFGLYIQGGTETVAFSTRAAVGDPFGLGNVTPAPINTSIEGTPRIAADNLALYFYSERAGGLGGRDLYVAQRPAPGTDFTTITPLTELNSNVTDHLPWVSADQRSIYFASDRAGSLDLYRSVRGSVNAAWGVPQPVTELNTAGFENGMTLTADEREIVFVSDRAGGSDFFRAVRAPGQTAFNTPEFLTPLNDAAEDADPAFSPDGRELYFASRRDSADSRLWRVSRTCP